MAVPVLKTGCFAYWDTFAGPVPCKVTAIKSDRPEDTRPATWQRVEFEVTEARGPYKAGERHSDFALHVFPRAALERREYSQVIGPYEVQA